jgi:hypothetical protein
MRSPNKLHHIFASRRHHLDRLVRRFGSQEAAAQAIQDAVDAAFRAGELASDARGIFETTLDVGGNPVTIRGIILDGTAVVGSAWIFT